ncbi:C-terminal binding protein [Heyndrickxia acidiproducens]|uniref:C-terminal binding protein n=1 Tax=Heyndrickxia acidiproducens TaxID=1121084 RepID=UPI00037B6911|nr:C-terminal binding protein [Heyndrickxia acidiproducens]
MKPLIWIIDEEWKDYGREGAILQKHFPDCTIRYSGYNYMEDLAEFGKHADAILCQVYVELPEAVIRQLTKCKIIAVYGGGFDRIDVKAAKEKNITVTFVPGYCVEDVSDFVIAAIYFFNKKLDYYFKVAGSGPWGAQAAGCLFPRISSSTLFIIGFGRIGKAVAEKAKKMGMNIIVYDRKVNPEDEEVYGVKFVPLEYGLQNADFVTLHMNLNEDNVSIISERELEIMKDSAYLINTARGALISEKDLIKAVRKNTIAGAMLDVIAKEPPTGEEEIFHCPNIFVTPHVSYLSVESLNTLKERAAMNVVKVLNGAATTDAVII